MALTPAEVHNVAFKKPPIGKRGYDERRKVDAFLDVVEIELSRLIEENNDLRSRGGGSPAPASSGGGADPAVLAAAQSELATAKDENQRLATHVAELEKALSQGKNGAQQQVVQLQQQLQASEAALNEARTQLAAAPKEAPASAAAAPAPGDVHTQAVQVLTLAQATAEQHIAQSKAEADALLTDAQQRATSQISEADARVKQLGFRVARLAQHRPSVTPSSAPQRSPPSSSSVSPHSSVASKSCASTSVSTARACAATWNRSFAISMPTESPIPCPARLRTTAERRSTARATAGAAPLH